MPRDMWVVTLPGEGCLLAFGGQRPGMLLNILQHSGQPPPSPASENVLPQTPAVLRLRKSGVGDTVGEKLRQAGSRKR